MEIEAWGCPTPISGVNGVRRRGIHHVCFIHRGHGHLSNCSWGVSGAQTLDQPILEDGRLIFPEGARIPKYMTETESRFLDGRPITPPRGVTPPPQGPIRGTSEYEAMSGILLAWEGFSSTLAQMAAAITTTGNADVYIACDSNSEANSARNSCISAGADPDRVITVVRSTNTVWIRDYGPRYVFEGDCRVIIDHTYNRPRPATMRTTRTSAPSSIMLCMRSH